MRCGLLCSNFKGNKKVIWLALDIKNEKLFMSVPEVEKEDEDYGNRYLRCIDSVQSVFIAISGPFITKFCPVSGIKQLAKRVADQLLSCLTGNYASASISLKRKTLLSKKLTSIDGSGARKTPG